MRHNSRPETYFLLLHSALFLIKTCLKEVILTPRYPAVNAIQLELEAMMANDPIFPGILQNNPPPGQDLQDTTDDAQP